MPFIHVVIQWFYVDRLKHPHAPIRAQFPGTGDNEYHFRRDNVSGFGRNCCFQADRYQGKHWHFLCNPLMRYSHARTTTFRSSIMTMTFWAAGSCILSGPATSSQSVFRRRCFAKSCLSSREAIPDDRHVQVCKAPKRVSARMPKPPA